VTVSSPCTSVCRMNAVSGLCEGCARTLDEIAAWSAMDDAQKRHVLQEVAQRKDLAAASPRNGSLNERTPSDSP